MKLQTVTWVVQVLVETVLLSCPLLCSLGTGSGSESMSIVLGLWSSLLAESLVELSALYFWIGALFEKLWLPPLC